MTVLVYTEQLRLHFVALMLTVLLDDSKWNPSLGTRMPST